MDFTRSRKLSFATTFLLVLQKSVKSIQVVLNEYIIKKDIDYTITASAFTQARQKLKHTAFVELNDDTVSMYYADNKNIKTFFGFRCVAADRSNIILPKIKEIEQEFGSSKIKNQYDNYTDNYNHAECLCYYDVLNNIAIKTSLGHCKNYEVESAINMLDSFNGSNDLLIYDRGYASYQMLATLIQKEKNFIVRMPLKFKEVVSMSKQIGPWSKDVVIKVRDQRKNILALGLPEEITVRFVRVLLSTGEVEILATSIDNQIMTQEDFRQLYWLRWGVETFFAKLKGRLSLENFTGKSVESVKQYFWSSIFISNIESIVTEDTENKFMEDAEKNKYKKHVNKAVSFNSIKTMAFEIFYSNDSYDATIQKLTNLFNTNPILERPNKTQHRTKIRPKRSLSYQKRIRKHVF